MQNIIARRVFKSRGWNSMMQIPQGVPGWTIFLTGLLIVAYRVHGIDAPRHWIEWVERQFTYIVKLRFVGGILLAIALATGYFGGIAKPSPSISYLLFVICILVLAWVGMGLLVFQNHIRHIVFATAESSDRMIQISSVVIVLAGLCIALAPFFA